MQLNTLFIGRSHIHLEETGSTNDVARELVSMKPAEGTLITVRRQTAGRGQQGHVWFSEADASLAFSVILYPGFLPPARVFCLQEAVTLAVCDALAHFLPGKDVSIKWPNDIVVEGRKIAGILLETSVEASKLGWAIIGIGVNVRNTAFPTMEGRSPTSVLLEGQNIEPEHLLIRILHGLESMYMRLRQGKYGWFKEAFEANMYLRGEMTTFILSDMRRMEARLEGISEDGRLVLNPGNESQQYFPETIKWEN